MEKRYNVFIKGKSVKNTQTRVTRHCYSFVVVLITDTHQTVVPLTSEVVHKETAEFDLPLTIYSPHLLTYKSFIRAMLWFIGNGMLNEKIVVYTDDSKVGKQMVAPLPGKKASRIPEGEDYTEEAKKAKLHMKLLPNLQVSPIPIESNSMAEILLASGELPSVV